MSYKTLAKDIADDIYNDIKKGILVTRSDIERALEESADGSEVSFKPAAATKYLQANNYKTNSIDNCLSAYLTLKRDTKEILIDLGVDI